MNKSTQKNAHAFQRLKQMVRGLPVLGSIANWLYGIVRMNALRRQNASEHAHFLALHQILEAQLAQLQNQHSNLLQQLEQQLHRHAQTQQQLEHQSHLQLQNEQQRVAVQQQTDQDFMRLRQQLEQAATHHQQQLHALQQAAQHQLAELRSQHEKAVQDIVQHTAQLDEQGLQADIATDMLAQRVDGLTKLLRQRNSTEESVKN